MAVQNGTALNGTETINLETGVNTGDFWAIYLPNLQVNAPLNPKANNGLIVNSTSTQTFADSTRTINNWSTDNVLVDSSDPTAAHSKITSSASASIKKQECSSA